MAHPEHLKVFHRGVAAWNRWRRKHRGVQPDLSHADLSRSNLRLGNFNNANLEGANLEGANLGRAYLESAELQGALQRGIHLFGADLGRADLRRAELDEAQLWEVRLEEADLRAASLRRADLRQADLSRADLRAAVLDEANLEGASLLAADLRNASLAGARLPHARLWDCRLDGADLAGATLAHTALENVDLSQTLGLENALHEEPSSVGIDTLERTATGLSRDGTRQGEIEHFLRGAGVRESYLEVFRERIGKTFGFYSAFIRYSHADQRFARRLYEELQGRGIRCWLHEHPMLPGDDAHEELELGPWDRLLLLASEAACTSWWIDSEIAHALEKERQGEARQAATVMIPVALDAYSSSGRWRSAAAAGIRSRLAADFSGWAADGATFERQLAQVVEALRVPPTPTAATAAQA